MVNTSNHIFENEPKRFSQNHFIYDPKWIYKTEWMKKEVEKNIDWELRLYIDFANSDYVSFVLNELSRLMLENWLENEFNKAKEFYEFSGFSTLLQFTLFLDTFLYEIRKKVNKITLFFDNIDLLDEENQKDINSLISIRERKIIYFVWIKWKYWEYNLFTNSSITILEWHDYFKYTIEETKNNIIKFL